MVCHSTPVGITLTTYSYTPACFEKPEQAKVNTSFTFNTEYSVRHTLAYWIHTGAGNYIDLDLLFCDAFQEPHWSGLSKSDLENLETTLRERKVEAVVQVVESLEALWKKGVYPPHQGDLWLISTAYEVWNGLTEQVWELHLLKHQKCSFDDSPGAPSPQSQIFNPAERDIQQKELEDFDGSSDGQYINRYCWMTGNLDGALTLPGMATRPEEDNIPAPNLSSPEIVSAALSYWDKKNKDSDYCDLEYLSYLWSEKFGGDWETSHNHLQGLGIRKSVAGWEIVLGLRQVLLERMFPPRDKIVSMVQKSFTKWNRCSHDVQLRIDQV
ncbi:uncharacterized protein LAJ45_08090 [Morchella importuna]|uniref:uncharacterized protein n=1 Tax=Morchella importuna TaxID=1174673 RepID=UPI001E8D1C61|nr:uncharacterized protein LAJ45_08090 [Morchella importuna]KAH8147988.1 hypothetical protein LAJ45_08090 [Morchella importuna]